MEGFYLYYHVILLRVRCQIWNYTCITKYLPTHFRCCFQFAFALISAITMQYNMPTSGGLLNALTQSMPIQCGNDVYTLHISVSLVIEFLFWVGQS